MKNHLLLLSLLVNGLTITGQKTIIFHVLSPDGKTDITIAPGTTTSWSVANDHTIIIPIPLFR